MIYLIIMFSVAAVGIGTLWLQQKRERSHLESSERFLSSLQKISPEVRPVEHRPRRRSAPHARKRAAVRGVSSRRPSKAEIARRQAARRRVEARRRAHAGTNRSRAVS